MVVLEAHNDSELYVIVIIFAYQAYKWYVTPVPLSYITSIKTHQFYVAHRAANISKKQKELLPYVSREAATYH